ncbi:hypothetical protein L596_030252 [Steinernema carpocapsae]|uniref:Uncharacterized protein n=1 Tax=Steinernema carpocapsae TaxID=34508 RepID=A0A4U5LS67_STECR|nr:hypothetical protein L596_030252 [Steinernema carpocapsae]
MIVTQASLVPKSSATPNAFNPYPNNQTDFKLHNHGHTFTAFRTFYLCFMHVIPFGPSSSWASGYQTVQPWYTDRPIEFSIRRLKIVHGLQKVLPLPNKTRESSTKCYSTSLKEPVYVLKKRNTKLHSTQT